ncbi:hypothetical protein PHSY_005251 [Pseudozyma hubeiensis SY62]|uniref:Uncharacterized protein n=1 Tax=Pseudozyma hubeiensis (strain SY62) TaxID=1305764 RepID=R9PHS7_PSEHS|nr:hypothetical protein PHSY_005251 [Pseudozyma hubeiensis SY62]GAC97665.1 hypothetical protein PHSY_005251 [Pseudozyma hubeiensis SY62]
MGEKRRERMMRQHLRIERVYIRLALSGSRLEAKEPTLVTSGEERQLKRTQCCLGHAPRSTSGKSTTAGGHGPSVSRTYARQSRKVPVGKREQRGGAVQKRDAKQDASSQKDIQPASVTVTVTDAVGAEWKWSYGLCLFEMAVSVHRPSAPIWLTFLLLSFFVPSFSLSECVCELSLLAHLFLFVHALIGVDVDHQTVPPEYNNKAARH